MPRRPTATAALVIAILTAGCGQPAASESPADSANPPAATSSPTPAGSASDRPQPSATPAVSPEGELTFAVETFDVPAGSRPHDVAPAADGGVWYVAQSLGEAGWLDPATGEVRRVPLGPGSAPHGVIVGPDDAAWITDGGLNAIVRVDPDTDAVASHALPIDVNANLNTATFDGAGLLWFTGQAGFYGRLDPASGAIDVFTAPRGAGPYGIHATPDGAVYYASLAGSYLGAVDTETGTVRPIDTPTPGGGARRVWSDAAGNLWITEWNAGRIARFDPSADSWTEWQLPGDAPMPYAIYVDETDAVWVTDFGANALHRFDPVAESFMTFLHDSRPAEVRQLLGRDGEVWGAESAADRLIVVRFGR